MKFRIKISEKLKDQNVFQRISSNHNSVTNKYARSKNKIENRAKHLLIIFVSAAFRAPCLDYKEKDGAAGVQNIFYAQLTNHGTVWLIYHYAT